jgi:hypothetical protein
LPIAAACFGILLPAAKAAASVTVTVEPPLRADVGFDRDRPPSHVPADVSEGSAVCSNVFEIEAKIASAVEVLSPTTVRLYPDRFDITTRLRTTIYLPSGSPDKLRKHEEGHRAIGEHYYGYAKSAAETAAQPLVGRAFEASGADRAAAEQAAGVLVRAALRDAFMQRTHARSAAANARYDAATDHGRNAVTEEDAIVFAIAEDP